MKTEADSLKKIEIWWLKKHGYLIGWKGGSIRWTHRPSGYESSVGIGVSTFGEDQSIRIYYTQTEEDGTKKDFDYKIPLTTTPCYLGGYRYWFNCPWYANKIYCGKRVGVLYKGGDYFACRHCYNLSYASRNQSRSPLFSAFDLCFEGDEIAEKQANLRVKNWKGTPTKKYMKLERKGWVLARRARLIAPLIDGWLSKKK